MLLEIPLGREVESFRGLTEFAAYLPRGEPTPYTDYRIAARLFEKRVRMDVLIPQPLLKVIERCLDPVFFSKLLTPSDPQGLSKLCEEMYEKLVAPLELLVQCAYGTTNGLWPLHELNSTMAATAPSGVAEGARPPDPGRISSPGPQTTAAKLKGLDQAMYVSSGPAHPAGFRLPRSAQLL